MQKFKLELLKAGAHVHFIGIGGISMSALAEILCKSGFIVSGSDLRQSSLTNKLQKMGVTFYLGHAEENIAGAELIVHTAAINESNPELQAAKQQKILTIDRPTLLGEIMRKYAHAIAVSGTHGKTTTTSMVSSILMQAELDPTVLVGEVLETIDGNLRLGNSSYFVTEACEYCESFLKFYPYIGIILNVEADHLDYFENLEHIIASFKKFAKLVPQNGYIIVCGDDLNALKAVEDLNCNILTYGIKQQNNEWFAKNITFNESGFPTFDVMYRQKYLTTIELNVPGIHNVYNALAAIACAYILDVNITNIRQGIFAYKGANRRFEIKGKTKGFTVISDYAHHPTEIKATLAAAAKYPHKKLWCVFQPHTYTRTLTLMDDFSHAFTDADQVIITDIYAAREKDNGKVHSKDLVQNIHQNGYKAKYISGFKDIASYVLKNANEGDIIITMGAGSIDQLGDVILKSS